MINIYINDEKSTIVFLKFRIVFFPLLSYNVSEEVMGFMLWWLFIFIFFVVVELSTVNLVSIWFALGALASLFLSLVNHSFEIQLAVFIMVSAISLILTRPLVKKFLSKPMERTNLDRIIGKIGIVTEKIVPYAVGEVKIDGKLWSAISDEEISLNSKVEILSIQGAKVTVRAVKEGL